MCSDTLRMLLQVAIGFGIYNVWLVRPRLETAYRGGAAKNLREEFLAYGLPSWFMYVIGTLKLTFATLLIYGIAEPSVVRPAAIGMALLMLGAVIMHGKVKDDLSKTIPALIMFGMSVTTALLTCG